MRRADDMPMDPEIAAELDVIDATLAGEPVAPEQAELAELTLLLADERPRPEASFVGRLDARATVRFAARGAEPTPSGSHRATARWWLSPWSMSAAGALAAAVVAIIIVTSGGGSHTPALRLPTAQTTSGAAKAASPDALSAPASVSSSATSAAAASGAAVQPVPNGRKVVQSAQLSLSSAPSHVDDVAQEVFNAVGLAGGIVNSSTVTATSGSDGYAEFQLSIPSSGLPQTMAALSRLRYASVASRTDSSQDVNDRYQATVRQLADARALRTALLRQLAAATTAQQIAAVKAQIRDAEASIAGDEAALRSLNRRISYSHVAVSINAAAVPVTPAKPSHGFTIGQAWHDAGRILAAVAAGAIVVLAVLVPVALLLALGLWIAALVRRHRREQALDLA